jgi:hypothetical protein
MCAARILTDMPALSVCLIHLELFPTDGSLPRVYMFEQRTRVLINISVIHIRLQVALQTIAKM